MEPVLWYWIPFRMTNYATFYPWLILIGTFRFMNNFTECYRHPPSLDCCVPFELHHTHSLWSVLCFFALKTEEVGLSEISVTTYKTKQCYHPAYHSLTSVFTPYIQFHQLLFCSLEIEIYTSNNRDIPIICLCHILCINTQLKTIRYAFLTCNSVVLMLSSIHVRSHEVIVVTVWSSESQVSRGETSCHV